MQNKSGSSVSRLASFLFPFVKPHITWVFVDVFCALVSTSIPIINAFLLGKLINAALSEQYNQLLYALGLMTLLTIANVVTAYFRRYAYASYGAYAIRDLRNQFVKHINKLPVSFMEEKHSGDIISRLYRDGWSILSFLESNFSDILIQPFVLIVVCVYLFFIDWRLFLICAIILPLSLFLTNLLSKPLEKYSRDMSRHWSKVNEFLQDTIGGIYILKAFNLERPLYNKYNSFHESVLQNNLQLTKRQAPIEPLNALINFFPPVLCIIYGGYLSVHGQLNAGELMTSLQLLRHASFSGRALPEALLSVRVTIASVDRLSELFNQPVERQNGEKYESDKNEKPIEFKDVTFSYKDELKIFNKISFSIENGKTIALVGPSGAGKSTIFKLLCGFYQIQAGKILLYGKDFNQWSLTAARSLFSLVSQDTYLYPTTVFENISYGCPGADMGKVIDAAKAANAHEFIQQLPDRYNTLVGERGIRLSGGQKQRISIARAILKDAPILLLDEPTSALDTQSEAMVQQSLEKLMKGRTVLVIAHRLSTIKNADEVFVIDDAQLKEKGTHGELIEKDGIYKQLYTRQFAFQNADATDDLEEGA